MYYSLKNDEKLVTDVQIATAIQIMTGETVSVEDIDSKISECKGVAKKVEKPSIERLVANGQLTMAAKIFADQNKSVGMTTAEAKNFLKRKYEKGNH